MSKIINILPWIIGTILLFFMTFVTSEISKAFGIFTYIDYGETITISHPYYDEDSDGHQTGFGLFCMFLSFAVAIRGGMAVYTRTLNGGVSALGNTQLLIILGGLLLYGVTNPIIYFILELPAFPGNLLDLICGAGIGYLAYTFYKKKEHEL